MMPKTHDPRSDRHEARNGGRGLLNLVRETASLPARVAGPAMVIALLAGVGIPAAAQPTDDAAIVSPAIVSPDRSDPSPTGKHAALSACVSADNGDPVLTRFALIPRRVDVRMGPAQIVFTVQAADTGGPGDPDGIAAARLFVHNDRVRFFGVALHEVSPGVWAGKLTLHPWSEDGVWKIGVRLTDAAGHEANVPHGALMARGLPAAFTVRSAPDRIAPVLTALALDGHHVDTTAIPTAWSSLPMSRRHNLGPPRPTSLPVAAPARAPAPGCDGCPGQTPIGAFCGSGRSPARARGVYRFSWPTTRATTAFSTVTTSAVAASRTSCRSSAPRTRRGRL